MPVNTVDHIVQHVVRNPVVIRIICYDVSRYPLFHFFDCYSELMGL